VPCSIRLDMAALRQLVRRLRPHVIHAHSRRTFAAEARLARCMALPLVITCHARTLIRPVHEPAFAQARRIICPWEALAEGMCVRGGRNGVFHIWVDMDLFPYLERPVRGGLRVLYLGRTDHRRRAGADALCRAVWGLPGVELVMATDRRTAPW